MPNVPIGGYETDIREEFLEGIDEVFSIMFTDNGAEKVKFHFMDDEATKINDVYRETDLKVYKDPIELVAKVVTHFTKEDLPSMDMEIDAIITVPTLELIKKEIPRHTLADLKTLTRGKFSFKDVDPYNVERVVPTTLVAGEWQFYVFYCQIPK